MPLALPMAMTMPWPMLPKAEMVPKECGFNQSETAWSLCAGIARRFPCLPPTVKDGELIKMQHSCYHVGILRQLKLRNNQTVWNVYMSMQQ